MRYLTLSKNGVWSFRFQIPTHHRPLFEYRYEIKKCLKTSCRSTAQLLALQLELEIRRKIADSNSTQTNVTIKLSDSQKKRKLEHKNCPYECLATYKKYNDK